MKKQFQLLFVLISNSFFSSAQLSSYSDYFREGCFLLQEENYDLALKNFVAAYKLDSTSANINFNLGYTLMNSSNKKTLAEIYLAKAITDISKNYRQDDPQEKSAPPLAHFYYGRALHNNYKFEEAGFQYNLFETTYAKEKEIKEEVAFYKAQTTYAKELMANPVNVQLENLGDSINSPYPDFSPVLSADERTLIYTTRRNNSTGEEIASDGQFYEDIVISYKDLNNKWSRPKPISKSINTNGNEASINLTPDGQTLIVYQDVGAGNGGNIYYSDWNGNDWSALKQFGSDINTKYWETHGCLTNDRNTLYFVSDRPGGFGGRDIYRAVKLPNGAWSKALNLGATINTKQDEDGVFMHPDGVTLIFASRGHKTIGGFDLFSSTRDEENKFSTPQNLGFPINTPDDEVFFVTSPDGKRGYFSSAKDGGYGEKDLYQMFIPDAQEKPLALFKGLIIPAEGEKLPEDIVILVTDKESGEVVGAYRPKENGSFSTILPPNKTYNFSYQAKDEEFYNEDLFVTNEVVYQEIKKEINLEPVSLLGKIVIKGRKLILNAIVLNNPIDKKPVSNAYVILSQKYDKDLKYTVNVEGKKEDILLDYDKSYVIAAESNGIKSKVYSFSTSNIKGSKSITQVIYLEGSEVQGNVDPIVVKDKIDNNPIVNSPCENTINFNRFFSYNQDETTEENEWAALIDALVVKSKECTSTIKVLSSASKVPTHKFASNEELAKSRAEKIQSKLKEAIAAKGGDVTKLKFSLVSAVRGPSYAGDAFNQDKYSKYQYVKVIAK
ncbi:MAG: hypothetical protein ACK504_07700 [Bacteroidota bacterium]